MKKASKINKIWASWARLEASAGRMLCFRATVLKRQSMDSPVVRGFIGLISKKRTPFVKSYY